MAIDQAGRAEQAGTGREGIGGSFRCRGCGLTLGLTPADGRPSCPECGSEEFDRASLFSAGWREATDDTTEVPVLENAGAEPEWLAETRERASAGSPCLILDDDGTPRTFELRESWTRIGRSVAAGIRIDDPTVSRRHAVIVCSDGGVHVLDDRSVNGVRVNDEPVEWEQLNDGDRLTIGRFQLHFVD